MCGIAGFHLKDPGFVKKHEGMERFADVMLDKIEMRGKQATGFIAVTADNKQIVVDKRPVNATEFIKNRKPFPAGTRTVLLHTRWATQGSNEHPGNLHPVLSGTCWLTHNGVINNDDDLFKEHALVRHAEVDTEIIPALINKVGWENADKAFEKLRGSFAVAAVDPVQHPGKLILAKGSGSPLYVWETDKFITWASTAYAIREAWGEVLGTPPAFNKIPGFKEGQLMLIDGKDRTLKEFKLPFVQSGFGQSKSSGTKNGGFAGGSSSSNQGSGSFIRGIIRDRREPVAALRAEGKGQARVWPDDEAERIAQRKEILSDPHVTRIMWTKCYSCFALVLDNDFRYIPNEGRVCSDCQVWHYTHKDKGVDVKLDASTKETLETWCAKEAEAHRLALKSVSDQTGLSVEAVDYVIFRVAESYTTKHPYMADLAKSLDDLYQEASVEAFDSLFDSHNDEGRTLDDAFEGAVERDTKKENTSPPLRCETCKKYKMLGKNCRFCEKKKESETGAKAKIEEAGKTRVLTKCWCGEPATMVVGRVAGFCQEHFEKCNIEDCKFGRHEQVNGKHVRVDGPGFANHLRQDGKRICHFHSRGEKGVWSDTGIKQAGFIIKRAEPAIATQTREPGGL